MTVLVVGSVAFDTIETPAERRELVLGGAANYFSLTAAFFTPVQLVAVVGQDFPQQHLTVMQDKGICLDGLQKADGKTFHWSGRYGDNFNERDTLATDLNVFADFKPTLPEAYRQTPYVFLANIQPQLQLDVLDQMKDPQFVAADTMNLWIDTALDSLRKVASRVDALLLNEGEARQLSGEYNLLKAGRAVLSMGPKVVVVKLGEYGALIFSGTDLRFVPAFPLDQVTDPTGAGDTFGGGFVGHIAKHQDLSASTLHKAAAVGSVMGAFCCEDFGPERLLTVTEQEIEQRFQALCQLGAFDTKTLF